MIHVARIALWRKVDGRGVRQQTAIPRRQGAAPPGPLAEPRQPRPEDGRLQLVEAGVHAGLLVMVAVGLSAVAQPPDPCRQRAIVGDDGAAVTERAEILGRIEAERAGDADRADRTAGSGREVRLAAVFDDRQIVARGDSLERAHVGCLPVQMNRQNRARPRADRLFHAIGIDREADRIDVREHRARPGHHDRERRIGGRQRRRDDFVAGSDVRAREE